MADATDIASLSFEQALAELERIVGQLETGQAPLEDSIALYERGALLKAESTRQVRVLEAKARLEASRLEAEAEVRRAEGSAKAIAAIKKQLGGPGDYLRWLYIQGLQENSASGGSGEEGGSGSHEETIVYIPTDGLVPLPISEAGRVAR